MEASAKYNYEAPGEGGRGGEGRGPLRPRGRGLSEVLGGGGSNSLAPALQT